jgi:WD40 repeat protein
MKKKLLCNIGMIIYNILTMRQLRDLVQSSDTDANELYYVHENKIYNYNVATKQTNNIYKLDHKPASFCVRYGYMAAGGCNSELTVKDLKTNAMLSNMPMGGSINNACHIGVNRNNDMLLFTSNNDNTIKVFTIGQSLSQTVAIPHNVAVNYTSTSPDGKFMASVGDSNTVTLYEMRDSRTYHQIAEMKEYSDCGFNCSFDANSLQLAAASQDGAVVVWDIRKTGKPLTRLHTQQRNTNGAARAVKFSHVPSVDLLMFTEHESMLHVIDTRTYQDEQVLNVASVDLFFESSGTSSERNLFTASPRRDSPCTIVGASYSLDCRKIFVGMLGQIQEYNVDMLSRYSLFMY